MIKYVWAITIIIAIIFRALDNKVEEKPAAMFRMGLSSYYNNEYRYADNDGHTYIFDSSDVRKGDNFKFIEFMITIDNSIYYEWTYSFEGTDSLGSVYHPVITNFKVKLQTFNQ